MGIVHIGRSPRDLSSSCEQGVLLPGAVTALGAPVAPHLRKHGHLQADFWVPSSQPPPHTRIHTPVSPVLLEKTLK